MHKWKHGYLSKKQIKQLIKSESGITLVELLAAISILSVVILLAGSIHMFGQRQFMSQTESAEVTNDLSYALNIMTSDLRKQSSDNVTIDWIDNDSNTFEANRIIIIGTDTTTIYEFDNSINKLKHNGTVIADSVSHMIVEYDGTDIGIKITLRSNSKNSPQKEYHTKVTFRRLSENGT